jgi:NAD dependent epimerase/dehydratase
MHKVLVTGAEGFIGSHLTERLVREGCEVRAMALYNSFNSAGWLDTVAPETRSSIEILASDVRDPNAMRHAVKGCDTVFHLAALIAIPYSYYAPDSYVDTNIRGTVNVLQAARDAGVAKVVHTSTSEVYGTAQFVPITEEHPVVGQSPYSASKIGADHLALSFYSSFDLPVAVIRPFNVYGPRQSMRAVIPTIITQLARGERKVGLGATAPTRDFSFVADTVGGFLAVARSAKAAGEVINIGSGFEISIGDAARLIADVMGVEIEIQTEAQRLRPAKSEVERLFASADKAQRLLGWMPSYGGLEGFRRGLAETTRWFSEPANLAHYRDRGYVI